MAGGVNKVILIGNLGADPEVRFTPAAQAVANFRIATSESWTDKQGQKQERTEWHRIVAWGKLAELCGEYLTKGRQVYVEGKLQTREWTNKENQKQYTTEIVAQNVTFLAGGQGAERAAPTGPAGEDDFGPPPNNLEDGPGTQAAGRERDHGEGFQPVAHRGHAPAAGGGGGGAVFPPYGRSKGAPVAGASAGDLEFYASGCRRTLADPAKARWHDKERELLAAIEAEIARQGSGGAAPAAGGPSEDDIPF